MSEGFESREQQPRRWSKELVSMSLRAHQKLWYPMEEDYFWGPGLPSIILDTQELPLLLLDPDEIEDYAIIEKLGFFIGLIEGVDTVEELRAFMREQQDMLLAAREWHAKRMGMDVKGLSRYRATIRGLLEDAKGVISPEQEGQE